MTSRRRFGTKFTSLERLTLPSKAKPQMPMVFEESLKIEVDKFKKQNKVLTDAI